jgi:hypothetical protein
VTAGTGAAYNRCAADESGGACAKRKRNGEGENGAAHDRADQPTRVEFVNVLDRQVKALPRIEREADRDVIAAMMTGTRVDDDWHAG